MTAFDILAAGLAVLPIDPRTKRPPIKGSETYPEKCEEYGFAWGPYQTHLPSESVVRSWLRRFGDPPCWLGIACGEGSGNLEALDFDIPGKKLLPPGTKGVAPAWEPWGAAVRSAGYADLLERLVIVATPSGGRQCYYRCDSTVGNSALAIRPPSAVDLETNPRAKPTALIETRGPGGLVVCPPSPGYEFVQGDFTTIPTITPEERGILWANAIDLDEMPPEPPKPASALRSTPRALADGEISAGDDFDARATWEEILEPHGYRKVGRGHGRMQLWAHPDKPRGEHSARTGDGTAGDRFYSWSPNGGVPANTLLKKYMLFAHLNHGGNVQEAIREIGRMGFGSQPSRRESSPVAVAQRDDSDSEDDMEETIADVDGMPAVKRTIQWNSRQLPDVTADAIDALVGSNEPAHLFSRAGSAVRLKADFGDKYKIERLTSSTMRNEVAKVAYWKQMSSKGELKDCYVPKEIADNILAQNDLSTFFPNLEGLSTVPVLSPSGAFHRSRGYDAESCWYITGAGPWPKWTGVGEYDATGKGAAAFIRHNLFHDFPFEKDNGASLANAMALFLLPLVRPAISGPTPMHYVEAPQSRTGKSLLVEVCLSPALGLGTKGEMSTMNLPEGEEELSKTLTSALLEGDELIFLDNVKRKVNSPSLEMILTSHQFKFRPLTTNASIRVPVRGLFAMTTNNGSLSTDMAGRCILIRLDAQMERPEDREGFIHTDIRKWISDHRELICAAGMAMVEEWVAAGRPLGDRRKAGYEEWALMMGGILRTCGIDGFLANEKVLKNSAAGGEDEPWRDFNRAWWEVNRGAMLGSNQLFKIAEERDLLEDVMARGKNEKGRKSAFGSALTKRDGKVLDGLRLVVVRNAAGERHVKDGYPQYRLDSTDPNFVPPEIPAETLDLGEEVDPFADEE